MDQTTFDQWFRDMENLEKEYFLEFEVIDGVNIHRDGLTFKQWLKEK